MQKECCNYPAAQIEDCWFMTATVYRRETMRSKKILLATVISILSVALSLLASDASASAASHPLSYVVTAPIDFAGTTAQFGTVDLATGEFHQIGPDTPEPEVGLVPGMAWKPPNPTVLGRSGINYPANG